MSTISLNEENFERIVMGGNKTVLLDFSAGWCGPCRMQAPILHELADEMKDSVTVATVDVDENPGLARQFNVMSIPALIVVKDGKVADRRVGLTSKSALRSILSNVIG